MKIKQLKWVLKLSLLYCFSTMASAAHAPNYVSSNPAAVDSTVGTGSLQRYIQQKLGIKDDHGIKFGGAWIVDTNRVLSGGIPNPQLWTSNSSFLLGMTAVSIPMSR
jgi:carbohydrate-selective porin OprB